MHVHSVENLKVWAYILLFTVAQCMPLLILSAAKHAERAGIPRVARLLLRLVRPYALGWRAPFLSMASATRTALRAAPRRS